MEANQWVGCNKKILLTKKQSWAIGYKTMSQWLNPEHNNTNNNSSGQKRCVLVVRDFTAWKQQRLGIKTRPAKSAVCS